MFKLHTVRKYLIVNVFFYIHNLFCITVTYLLIYLIVNTLTRKHQNTRSV